MKLGILEADRLEQDTRQKFGSYAQMFQQLFLQIDPTMTFADYSVIDQQYPDHLDDCDAYLITGSKFSAYEDLPWIRQLGEYIVQLHQAQKKTIGICFGHQLITEALGGKTEKANQGWGIGYLPVDIVSHQPWMIPPRQNIGLLVSHQDQVTRLPEGAILLAKSAFCPIASYQLGHHIVTFQGHPEFSKDYNQQIIEKRRQMIGDRQVTEGIASLENDIDHLVVTAWLCRFLEKEGATYVQNA